MHRAFLLALADQRLPAGGHVHSGGVEQAVTDGRLHDAPSLAALLERRLRTAGLVAAGLAAAATGGDVGVLDAEADARMPSPAQREASRGQGRGLLRLSQALWPGSAGWQELGARPHHPVVLGRAAAAAGLDALDAASVAAYLAVSGPATAAQRLLGLDPLVVAAVTVRLGAQVDAVAAAAVAVVAEGELPDDSDPLLDLLAERHAVRPDRLFVS